jgi:uncharacterized linocin/CFP29 family protein
LSEAVSLGGQAYTDLTDATKEGYPVLQHMRRLVEGPLVSTPGLNGGLVLSMRGGGFSIVYVSHDSDNVRLYVEESVTFWNFEPKAAVTLVAPAAS